MCFINFFESEFVLYSIFKLYFSCRKCNAITLHAIYALDDMYIDIVSIYRYLRNQLRTKAYIPHIISLLIYLYDIK